MHSQLIVILLQKNLIFRCTWVINSLIWSWKMLSKNVSFKIVSNLYITRQMLERVRGTTALTETSSLRPWPWLVVSCSPKGKRFTHPTMQQPHIQTCTHMNKQEHTPIIPITRLQQGYSQQPDPSMESQMGAVYVCVCTCVHVCARARACVCVCVCVRVRWSRLGVQAHAEHLEC